MNKKSSTAKRNANAYINSILKTNERFGFTETVAKEDIEKAKSDVEKVFRKFEKLLAHS